MTNDWASGEGYRTSTDSTEVSATTYVNASPEAVFAVVADADKTFLTRSSLADVSTVGEQHRGVGTVYRWQFGPSDGPTLTFEEEVTEWVDDERVAYRATTGWDMAAMTHLEPEGDGTRVTFTLQYRLPSPWHRFIPSWLVRLGIRRALQNLRTRAENDDHSRSHRETLIAFDVEMNASPEDVFNVVSDPRSKLLWVPAIKHVRLDGQDIETGTSYTAASGIGPLDFEFAERIVALEEPTTVIYEGASQWGMFRTTWTIEPASTGVRARYRMEYWFPETLLGRFLGPIIAAVVRPWMSKRTKQRVKEVVEESLWPTPR